MRAQGPGQTDESYLRADQRACAALEDLQSKYAVTAEAIAKRRDAATAKLNAYLGDPGHA